MPTLHPNALAHAHGSAVIRSGDTAVVCGVRGEILGLNARGGPNEREDYGAAKC
jgi:exosome complex component RRP43